MATVGFFINPALGLLGLVTVAAGAFFLNMPVIIAGVSACLAGVGHIVFQLRNEVLRSKLMFNRGVRFFNQERYRKAEETFRRALEINPDNELAKHGIRKAEIYRH